MTVGLGNSINVVEGLNLTTSVCATILAGSLQISVSVNAFTSNVSATRKAKQDILGAH